MSEGELKKRTNIQLIEIYGETDSIVIRDCFEKTIDEAKTNFPLHVFKLDSGEVAWEYDDARDSLGEVAEWFFKYFIKGDNE